MKNKLAIVLTLSFTLTLALILNPLVTSVSAESIDQSNDASRDHVANRGSWGQSFTPTMKLLTQVDLALDSVGNGNTYTVTVNILESWDGTILGSATATVPPGVRNNDVGEFISFVFSTPIELTPGTQYIIQVDLEQYYHQGGTSDMISWYVHDTDSYSGGTAIQNGVERSDDMIFRTWGGMLTQEIAYDDGTRDGTVSHSVGKHLAVKFSLPYGWLEAKLLTARYYIYAGPTSFKVHVYDSDGATELTSPLQVTPTGNGWFDVDLTGFNILVTADFYITIEYETDYDPVLGSDASPPIEGRSYDGTPGSWFQKTTLDYMIRIVMQQVMHEPVYQGDLVINGNDVAVIRGEFKINGSIIIEENATLILRDVLLNFTQPADRRYNITLRNPLNGNPRLLASNSTITSKYRMYVYLLENSTATINNSTLEVWPWVREQSALSISASNISAHVNARENSTVDVYNSTISECYIFDSSHVQVHDSEIGRLAIGPSSVNCTISNLAPGLMGYWSFVRNCSVEELSGGSSPNVTLTNTLVQCWDFYFCGASYTTVSNSTFGSVSTYGSSLTSISDSTLTNIYTYGSSLTYLFDSKLLSRYLYAYGTSVSWLVNSTYPSTYNAYDQAQVNIAWYMDAHVVDSLNKNVPSANVTATYPNATVAGSKLTDANGWAKLTLMEKMMNATGEYAVGNYVVKATYESYSKDTEVSMTGNKQISLTLDFVIPEFLFSVMLPLFIVATLLAVIVYRRKH